MYDIMCKLLRKQHQLGLFSWGLWDLNVNRFGQENNVDLLVDKSGDVILSPLDVSSGIAE